MESTGIVKGSIKINAPASKIWDILTNPDKITLYTGSRAHTDWAFGSPITWEGEMQGTRFQNKGKVMEVDKDRLLRFTYWSGMGGDKDLPQNYSEISYAINPADKDSSELTYARVKIPTAIEKQIFEQHLPYMLEAIKKLAEEK